MYEAFLLSCPRSRQLYPVGDLHLPAHPVAATVQGEAMKETLCISCFCSSVDMQFNSGVVLS
jgi:hypothetical protein